MSIKFFNLVVKGTFTFNDHVFTFMTSEDGKSFSINTDKTIANPQNSSLKFHRKDDVNWITNLKTSEDLKAAISKTLKIVNKQALILNLNKSHRNFYGFFIKIII